MKQQFIRSCLAFLLCVSFCFAPFSGMDQVQAAPTSGADESIRWNISGDTLTISAVAGSDGIMRSYSYAKLAPWQQSAAIKNVKKVIIQDGVSVLGSLAFYGNNIHLESMYIAGSIDMIPGSFCQNIAIDKLYINEGTRSVDKNAFLGVVKTVYVAKSVDRLPLSAFGINNAQGTGTISYICHIYGYTDSSSQKYVEDYLNAVAATNNAPYIWTDGKKYALDADEDGIADANPKIVFTALDKSSVLGKATVTSSVSMSVGKTQKLKVTVPSYLTLVTKYSGTEGEVKATYKSKNSKIVAVDKNGKVTGKKKGTTTITTTLKLKNGTKKTFTTKVTVK